MFAPVLSVVPVQTTRYPCGFGALSDLSYGTNIWTDLSSVSLQSTRLTDRQTDGQTAFS